MFSYGYIGSIILKKIRDSIIINFDIKLASKSLADYYYNPK